MTARKRDASPTQRICLTRALVAAVLFGTIASPLHIRAQPKPRWIPTVVEKDSRVFIDVASLRLLEAEVVEATVERRYSQIREDSVLLETSTPSRMMFRRFYYTRSRGVQRFDCVGRRAALLRMAWYDAGGEEVRTISFDARYRGGLPEMGQRNLDEACRLARAIADRAKKH